MSSSALPVALVSGASRGLGAAIAVALGRVGHPVAVNDASSQEQADAVVTEIRGTGGRAAADLDWRGGVLPCSTTSSAVRCR